MSVTLKTSKPRLFSTVLDVIRRGRYIRTETFDFINDPDEYSLEILYDGEIESYIASQDGIILAYLNEIYGGADGLRTTRWVSTPYRNPKNQSAGKLLAATLANTADPYTAYWVVEFTSATAFTLTSSLEGAQGTGATNTDLTSTSTELTIGTNAWSSVGEGFADNDKFYFSVVDVYQLVNKLSADLAAAAALMERYSEAVPNANEYANKLYSNAMKLLDKLSDKDSPISLTSTMTYDLSSTAVDYNLGVLGEDKSSYLTSNDLDL